MSDLPEIKNEPTVELPRGDLGDFSRGYRSPQDRRHDDADAPQKSRLKYFPILLAILVATVVGWHLFAAHQLEERLNRNIGNSADDHSQDFSASVNVNPMTNLVDLQFTLKVKRNDTSDSFLENVILAFAREKLEPLA